MGTLANISGEQAVKAGWRRLGQKGSHLVLVRPGVRCNLTVPIHKELRAGTLRSLIRDSGLTVQEFIDLL